MVTNTILGVQENWRQHISKSIYNMVHFLNKRITVDIPQLTHEGLIWGIFWDFFSQVKQICQTNPPHKSMRIVKIGDFFFM